MPAGLTFAGRAWDDANLLGLAAAFEATGTYRQAPPRTAGVLETAAAPSAQDTASGNLTLTVSVEAEGEDRERLLISGETGASAISLTVDGVPVEAAVANGRFRAEHRVAVNRHRHSEWSAPWGHIVIAVASDGQAAFVETKGAEA
ncbi:MAG: hypothetical protein BGN83_14095 [Rhizobium sp. 63-7]|nr:MAG: hypothetical protein BGN83_14095 [Rhizobium sp. 63-7]